MEVLPPLLVTVTVKLVGVTKSADGVPLMMPVLVSKLRPAGRAALMDHTSWAPPADDAALRDGLLVTLCPIVKVIASTSVLLLPVYFRPDGATAFTVISIL
jgi:hypothetical protein